MATSPSTHTLSVLVQNKPGVLARIAGLISRRALASANGLKALGALVAIGE